MRLQDCDLIYDEIGHGYLGTYGDSGYGIIISVNGNTYDNYISAHPNSFLRYKIPENAEYFSCELALNDSSEDFASVDVEFIVDGNTQYFAHNIGKFCVVNVEFLLDKNSILEIKTTLTNKIVCHSLILNASFSSKKPKFLLCPIHKSKISTELYTKEKYDVCIASVINDGFIDYAKLLHKTIISKTSKNIKFVYFAEITPLTKEFCESINAILIPISCVYELNINDKKTLSIYHKPSSYCVAKFINAEIYCILDVDIICVSDISNLIERIENNSNTSISVCKDSHTEGLSYGDLVVSEWSAYKGTNKDKIILNLSPHEINSSLIINSGVIAGKKKAILGIEDTLRRLMPRSLFYLNENINNPVREQSLMNLAMIKYKDVEILHKKYNLQLLWEEVEVNFDGKEIQAKSEQFEPCLIHFNGNISKPYLDEFLGHFYAEKTFKIDRIKCGSKIAEELKHKKIIKILDLQNDDGIVLSFIKATDCKSYKVERITNQERITINAFEEPFSKPIEDKMLEVKQTKYKANRYDVVIVGNLDNPINVSILLDDAMDLVAENGFIVFNEYIDSEAKLENIKARNKNFELLKIKETIQENLIQKVMILTP